MGTLYFYNHPTSDIRGATFFDDCYSSEKNYEIVPSIKKDRQLSITAPIA